MHDYPHYYLPQELIRDLLGHIPHPPRHLMIRGTFPAVPHYVFLTIVGSRNHTSYGKEVCKKLIQGLKGYPVVIVSGLALGIDTIAHETALEVGLTTIAFPGSGLDESIIYPRANRPLAEKILIAGGCLISEFSLHQKTNDWLFPARNRLLAGISRATLVIEATHKSGTRITARLATEYNREVLTVPGNIFSTQSEGPHELLRMGAIPVTTSEHILEALGITKTHQPPLDLFSQCNSDEQTIITLLTHPQPRGELIRASNLPIHIAIAVLTQMEIKGFICESEGVVRRK